MSRRFGLYIAWLIAIVGSLICLYFSDIVRIQPCNLCWYQRTFLFPQAIILGIAAYRGEALIVPYALTLTIIGFFIALYQVLIQEVPGWNVIEMCGAGPSCASKVDIGLGFITIPMLSLVGFLAIALLLWGVKRECDK